MIRQLPTPTAFLNRRLEVVCASDSWVTAFEIDRERLPGRPVEEVAPHAPKSWFEALQCCLEGGQGLRGIDRFIGEGNRESWFEWVNSPWFDAHENVIGVLVQATDITRQVQGGRENERLRSLLAAKSENARIGSWWYDAPTETLSWSDMTRQIHEVPGDFVPTLENAVDFYAEGYSRNTISMAVFRAMEQQLPWKEHVQLVTHTGREIWVIVSGRPLFSNGEYMGLLGTYQDVTDLYLSNQKTRESEKLLRTVVDNLPLNLYLKDLESRKMLVNKAECAYMGVSRAEELLGRDDFALFPAGAARLSREEDLYVMDNGKPILGRETQSVRKDGSLTHFLTSKIPLYDADDQVYGLMGISLDISDLKQKESELRDLIRVASLQNKKLVNFAHIVSHNLRSHTANFSMLLDFLAQEPDEAEKRHIIGLLTKASDNLLETLDNLNEVVAINSSLSVEKCSLNLHGMIEEARETLSAIIAREGAELINRVPAGARLQASPAYLENILLNFISNAVKYRHPDRTPEVRLSLEHARGHTVLVVSDNGLGIDMKKNGSKLFGMYKTFHEHPEARGIGLFICQNQIEAMNGFITTQSEVGVGTTFKLHFHD